MAKKDHYLKSELYDLVKSDESIFDFIQESALDGLWYWDIENQEDEWMNPRFWTVLGYDPEEMPHKASAWQDIIHPDDLQVAITNFHAHCEDPNHPYDQIVRYKHRNGSTVWVRCRGMAIRDDAGKPVRMLGAHHEVTKLKEAEEMSRQFKAALDQSFDMVALTDANGIVEYVNDAFTSKTGFTAGEVTGRPLPLIDNGTAPELDKEEIRNRLLTGKSWQGEFQNRRKDGSQYWEKTTISPVQDGKGEITHFLVIADDITEQKETQLALIESEERFKAIFEQSRSVKLVIDQETGKIVNASKTALEFYGYPGLLSMHIQDINQASPEEVRRRMKEAEGKKQNYFLFQHKTASGEIKDVEVNSTPIKIEGRIYLFSIIHDIAERVQAEKALKEHEQILKEAVATKDRFISILGHDLKNSFQAIIGLSDYLLDKNEEIDDTESVIALINQSSVSTFKMLENLLQWSSSQRNNVPFQPVEVTLYKLVAETAAVISASAEAKKIVLTLDVAEDLTAEADEEMVKTIIRNLLGNAVKFTPEGGEVKVTAQTTDDTLVLRVADNGIGMNEKTVQRLFRIDQVVSRKGTNGETGTGFGLLLCKEFVEKHNGSISVESEEGKGSAFTVTLPLKQ